jgi:hypothetical protein
VADRHGRPSATATLARFGVDAGVPAPQAIRGIGQGAISLRPAAGSGAVSLVSASSTTVWTSRRPPSASTQRSRVEAHADLLPRIRARRFDDDGNRGYFVSNKPGLRVNGGLASQTRVTPQSRTQSGTQSARSGSQSRSRKPRCHRGFQGGETRTRTGDTTIFSWPNGPRWSAFSTAQSHFAGRDGQ